MKNLLWAVIFLTIGVIWKLSFMEILILTFSPFYSTIFAFWWRNNIENSSEEHGFLWTLAFFGLYIYEHATVLHIYQHSQYFRGMVLWVVITFLSFTEMWLFGRRFPSHQEKNQNDKSN
jgi:hypothetical protein